MAGVLLTATPCCSLLAQGDPVKTSADPDSALARRIAGCYLVLPGPWQTYSGFRDLYPPPKDIRFELRTELMAEYGGPPWHHVVNADSARSYVGPLFTSWIGFTRGSNRIHVSSPLPFGGIALTLTVHGDDLVGEMISFTDVVRPFQPSEASSFVRVRRVRCRPPAGDS